jgi:ABC-type nitrate/sulfonate/bicarbonate transport system substrate-binding protein
MSATTTVTVTRCAVPTASSLALDDGRLAEALAPLGLEAGELGAGPARGPAHFDHSAEWLLREGGNVPALWARSRGATTRLVGLTWTEEYQAIVTRPGGPDGLRGTRLGVVRDRSRMIDHYAAMSLRGHLSALRSQGLGPDDATLVDLDVPLAGHAPADTAVAALPMQWRRDAEALMSGAVDAIYVKGAPGLATVAALGLDELVVLSDEADPLLRVNNGTPRTITAGEDLLAQPEVLGAMLGALLDAADAAALDPGPLHARVAADTGADPDAAAAAYGAVRLHPRLDDGLIEALDRQRTFLHANGFLAADLDIDAWIDPEPLAEALRARGPADQSRP